MVQPTPSLHTCDPFLLSPSHIHRHTPNTQHQHPTLTLNITPCHLPTSQPPLSPLESLSSPCWLHPIPAHSQSRPQPRPQPLSWSTAGGRKCHGALGLVGSWPVWGLQDQERASQGREGRVGRGIRPRRSRGQLSRCEAGRAWSWQWRDGRMRRLDVTDVTSPGTDTLQLSLIILLLGQQPKTLSLRAPNVAAVSWENRADGERQTDATARAARESQVGISLCSCLPTATTSTRHQAGEPSPVSGLPRRVPTRVPA